MSELHWSSRFIGIPFARYGRSRAGLDCWGLVALVYAEVPGIVVPSYDEVPADPAERAEMARLVADIASTWPWQAVGEPRELDVAVYRMGALYRHVGVVLDGGVMLHVAQGGTSSIVSLRETRWRHRLIGYCRHAELGGRP
jgi:cell wall-associated NlpC family hydrolase